MVAGLSGIRVQRRGGSEQVSGVIGWTHALGEQAHCLARLVLGAPTAPVVAVLSEIASNPDELGITGDFAAAADAFLEVLTGAGRHVNPREVAWIAHHGPFSSYDPAGPETFTEIALAFDGHHYHDDLVGDRLLTEVEVTQRVTPLRLRPVAQVLTDVGQLG